MNVLMRLAARGYGWYLALKIGKALLAVPCFVAWLFLWPALALFVFVQETVKLLLSIAAEAIEGVDDFWGRPWFRGFTRRYYESLEHYQKYRPLPPLEVNNGEPGA